MGKTLRRYLLREIGGAFLAGIFVFSFFLFLLRAIDLLEMIFARGVPTALVARLLLAIFPAFLESVLPMAFLVGVVVALARLSADGEILALRASGIGVYQVLPPVVAVSVLVSAATLALSMTARPWGHREIERTAFEIAKTRASAALRPRFFNTDFEKMVVYVDRIDAGSGDLAGVMISDERSAAGRSTVFARRGKVGGHESSGELYLQLLDGTAVATSRGGSDYDVTDFRSLEVNLELRTMTGSKTPSDEPAALAWSELRRDLAGTDEARRLEASVEFHRRLAISVAALALALVGTALGLQPARSARGRSLGAALGVILLFYGLLTLAVGLARSRALPSAVALALPDAALLAAAAWALARVARDRALFPAPAPSSREQGAT